MRTILPLAAFMLGKTLFASDVLYTDYANNSSRNAENVGNNVHSIDTIIADTAIASKEDTRTLVLTPKALATSKIAPEIAPELSSLLVVLDPGHDNVDVGAYVKKQAESKINLLVTEKLYNLLRQNGISVITTRHDAYRVNKSNLDIDKDGKITVRDELFARLDYIKKVTADTANLYINIHCNADPRSSRYKGVGLYTYGIVDTVELNDKRKNFHNPEECKIYSAYSVQVANRLAKYLMDKGLEVEVYCSDLRMVRNSPAKASILVELGYLTNPSDFKMLTSDKGQQTMAEILADFTIENAAYLSNPKANPSLFDIKRITSESTQELCRRLLSDFTKENENYFCAPKYLSLK